MELADWELNEAFQSAKEDREWQKEDSTEEFKGGQIGVNFNFMGGQTLLKLRGIGRGSSKKMEVAPAPIEADEAGTASDSSRRTKISSL